MVRWLERYPEFASMYAHARTLQADLMAVAAKRRAAVRSISDWAARYLGRRWCPSVDLLQRPTHGNHGRHRRRCDPWS